MKCNCHNGKDPMTREEAREIFNREFGAWLSKRLGELHMQTLKRVAEEIQNDERMASRQRGLAREDL